MELVNHGMRSMFGIQEKNNIPKDFIDLAKKRYQHNDSDSLYAKQLFEQIN